jgi:hypothetical protein
MPSPTEEPSVLHTVTDLLAAVEQLPAPDRAAATARIHAALDGDARSCRAALGLLALDLTPSTVPADARELEVRVHVVDLDRVPVRASA